MEPVLLEIPTNAAALASLQRMRYAQGAPPASGPAAAALPALLLIRALRRLVAAAAWFVYDVCVTLDVEVSMSWR